MGNNLKSRNNRNISNLLLCIGLFINSSLILVNRFIVEIPDIISVLLALSSAILIITSVILNAGKSRKRREHDGGEE